MRICIVTSLDSYFRPVAEITVPVLMRYCDRHGYALNVRQNPPVVRSIVWDRARLVMDALDGFDVVIWWDCDVLVTNPDIRLEDIIAKFPNEADVIVSRDHQNLNDGVIFSRGMWAKELWGKLWEMESEVSSLGAMWRFAEDHPDQTVLWAAPQRWFNSYDYTLYPGLDFPEGQYHPGDFCWHAPGMPNDRRIELMKGLLA